MEVDSILKRQKRTGTFEDHEGRDKVPEKHRGKDRQQTAEK